MNPMFSEPPALIEWLIHLLELSVVIGIGIIIWVNKNYSGAINKKIQQRPKSEDSLH